MTDKDFNDLLKAVSNLSDAVIEIQKRQLAITTTFEQVGKALVNHKEYMELLAKMVSRIARSSSDPTLADDLNALAELSTNKSPKEVKEEVPPGELLN